MKILFVAANPASLSPLALDEEIRAIEQEIISARFRDTISFKPIVAARTKDLIRALNNEKPDVVHFSGHGDDEGGLLFVGDDGEPVTVDPVLLAQLLDTLEVRPKLVVLNACFSFKHADAIATVVDTVIGIPGIIDDGNAVIFSGQLYGSLADGVSVDRSFRQGFIGTQLVNKDAWQESIPMIMNRPGSSPTSTVLVQPPPSSNALSISKADALKFTDRTAGRTFLKEGFGDFCKNRKKLAIAFLDIEGMSAINNLFERKLGDRVLTQALLLVQDSCGAAIASGICGDDTFFCVFESDDRQEVIRAVRNIMINIETYDWPNVAWGLWVRVEGGFAIWRPERETPIEAMFRAGLGLRHAQTENRTLSEGTEHPGFVHLVGAKNSSVVSEIALATLFS